jgi:2-C-methyl-D-erythritol 4-phosphate cytidylyltransferase
MPKDSVRIKNGKTIKSFDRNNVYFVQTPQCFNSSFIKQAYNQKYKPQFTDDIQVLETFMETEINIVEGNRENIKITECSDLMFAEYKIMLSK